MVVADELMLLSRYVNVGLFYLRQLFFANFDLKVHTDQGECSAACVHECSR